MQWRWKLIESSNIDSSAIDTLVVITPNEAPSLFWQLSWLSEELWEHYVPNMGDPNAATQALENVLTATTGQNEPLVGFNEAYIELFGHGLDRQVVLAAPTSWQPFLRKPFDGFYPINSFLDHDGKLRNGSITRVDGRSLVGTSDNCILGYSCYDGHTGIDYATETKEILAAATGKVIIAGQIVDHCGGNLGDRVLSLMKIEHNNGLQTSYLHLSSIANNPRTGQRWKAGDTINEGEGVGNSGTTGCSTGNHLHFQITEPSSGNFIDPYGWWGDQNRYPPLFNFPSTVVNAGSKGFERFYRNNWNPITIDGRSLFYTNSRTNPDYQNWALWWADIPTSDRYEVQAFIPAEAEATGITYKIMHRDGITPVTRDQGTALTSLNFETTSVSFNQTVQSGRWISLGTYFFDAHGAATVLLSDYTTGPGGKKIFFDTIKWVQVVPTPATKGNIALSIDRSGSMQNEGKIDIAKKGARFFTSLMPDGSGLAVTSFSDNAQTDFPLTILNKAGRDAAKTAIERISTGNLTNIDAGLKQAFNELVSRPSDRKAIFLMSDGVITAGPSQPDLANLKASKVIVHSVAIGSDADQPLMQKIARETGGKYLAVSGNPFGLIQLYLRIIALFRDWEQLFVGSAQSAVTAEVEAQQDEVGVILPGQTVEKAVPVDAGVTEISFSLIWLNEDSQLGFTLISPDGTVIDENTTDPNVEYTPDQDFKIYLIQSPQAGQWTMRVIGDNVPSGGETYLLAVSGQSDLRFTAAFEGEPYRVGQPINVVVNLAATACGGIDGAAITARVTFSPFNAAVAQMSHIEEATPDEINLNLLPQQVISPTTIVLQSEGGGRYRGIYTQATEPGSYNFDLEASGDSCLGAFTRQTQLSTFVDQSLPTTIRLVPGTQQIVSGSTATSTVQIDSVSNLYGVEFHLTYDPAIVQVVDADPALPGIQIGVGNVFAGKDYFVARNLVNPNTGVIEFSISLQAPAAPFEGSGSLAAITWQGRQVGASNVVFDSSKLSDRNGNSIFVTSANGSIEVTPSPDRQFSGTVLLQGRSVYSGTQIFLSLNACPATLSLPLPGTPSAVTDPAGVFKTTFPADRNYQCAWAVQQGYLVGQKSLPSIQGNLGTITLPGGDVNGDQLINILDLAFMAIRYKSNDPQADINADGQVNIFDLVIVAGNYNQRGPVTNWQ